MSQAKEKDDQELAQIAALVESYLGKAKGRLAAGMMLKEVDETVRKAKLNCIFEHFGG